MRGKKASLRSLTAWQARQAATRCGSVSGGDSVEEAGGAGGGAASANAGKPAGYLYNQLINFRDGRRHYPMMTYMVEHLPDAYLREIADYFSQQHPPYSPPAAGSGASASAASLARGQRLVQQGDPGLKLPACVACHGAALTGVAPAIPGLLGLSSDYINAQFGAWRNQSRRAAAPDCMADIAGRLTGADIAAISAWLGRQTPDADARPAAATSPIAPLPLRCGSVPAP